MLAPLRDGLRLLGASAGDAGRDAVLVLVTDGQVGNEDEILREITSLAAVPGIHTVGIDRAVNAGFLGRLAALGAGRCELVESEDRLDEAMEQIHRRIGAPVVTDVTISADGPSLWTYDHAGAASRCLPGRAAGRVRPLHRYAGRDLHRPGRTRDGRDWSATVPASRRDEPAVTAQWARARLRDLEDRYAGRYRAGAGPGAADRRHVAAVRRALPVHRVRRGGQPGGDRRRDPHRVTQPVEQPSGWTMPVPPASPVAGGHVRLMAMPVDSAVAGAPGAAPPVAPGVMRMPRSLRRSGPIRPVDPSPGTHDELVPLRELAATEALRLRDGRGRPDAERRDMLADLVSRLSALLGHLASVGVPADAVAPLAQLVQRLRSDDDLDTLWAEAVRVLEMFAGTTTVLAAGREPDPDAGGAARRRAFWKR